MGTTWIAFLVFAAAPASELPATANGLPPDPSENPATEASASTLEQLELQNGDLRKRTGRELLAAAREALGRLARPEDEELEAAAEELLYIYQELLADEAMARSYRVRYTLKVQLRLKEVSDQLEKRIAHNKRLAKKGAPEQVGGREQSREILAQRAAAAPNPPLVAGGQGRPRQRLPNDDYGQQLVDLIQKTIAPDSWDVNGGLGTIYYWRPGRALVVRQTGAVHEEMSGVLEQLRRAGP